MCITYNNLHHINPPPPSSLQFPFQIMCCNDGCCENGDEEINTIVNIGRIVQDLSLQINNDNLPVISYFDGSVLKVASCTEPCCHGFVEIVTANDDAPTGQYTSLELDDKGRPVISYYSLRDENLLLTRLENAKTLSASPSVSAAPSLSVQCSNVVIDDVGDVGQYTSMACSPSTGFAVVAYQAASQEDLKLVICGDRLCTANNIFETLDVGNAGFENSLALDSAGNVYVSYLDGSGLFVKFYSSPGGAVDIPIATVPELSDTSLALTLVGELPIIGYYDSSRSLSIIYCAAINCFDTVVRQVDTSTDVGLYNSMKVNSLTGSPIFAYLDSALNNLKVLKCGDPSCSSISSISRPDPTSKSSPTQFPLQTSVSLLSAEHLHPFQTLVSFNFSHFS